MHVMKPAVVLENLLAALHCAVDSDAEMLEMLVRVQRQKAFAFSWASEAEQKKANQSHH